MRGVRHEIRLGRRRSGKDLRVFCARRGSGCPASRTGRRVSVPRPEFETHLQWVAVRRLRFSFRAREGLCSVRGGRPAGWRVATMPWWGHRKRARVDLPAFLSSGIPGY